ncbi:MAG: hypothetical protein WDA47_07530 [Bacilli bacterium]|jgi:hypothetical protein
METLQSFFSWIWGILKGVVISLLSFLPDSPFTLIENSSISEYLGYINYIVPVSQIVAILQAWVVAIAVYYIYQAILRWVKLTGS